MKIALILAVISIVFLNSCATIVSGTSQDVLINTTPKASIEIKASSGLVYYSGNAPASVKLPRKYTYVVTIKASGYKQQTVIISKEFNAWFVGNLLFGGIPGGVVDAVTGAMWNLEPSIVNVSLERVSANGKQDLQLVFTDASAARSALRIPLEIM